MQLHTISAPKHTSAKRIGRGGKRGTFSGRGTKGQKARAGRRIRPQLRDILKKIPKKRGYRFTSFRARPIGVNLSILNEKFESGGVVSPQTLVEGGMVSRKGGAYPSVKILGTGIISKKLTIEGCQISASAKEKIEKAGGKLVARR
ncbi:MAG: large subunit ribosomal protein L15 [Parcubacteria group bacterium Gr01-1014_29]|nr:MAG: large subunit ribosomal protein L15 [Parcubacteria group bacterium Gr01-1014_29]